MSLMEQLLATERALANGDGQTYREGLVDDAVVIVPGQRLTREQAAEAIDASPGWDDVELVKAQLVELADGVAMLVYRFRGHRPPNFAYAAEMTSVYVERHGEWKMALHQETPVDE